LWKPGIDPIAGRLSGKEYVGFYAGMDQRGDWEPVPILVAGCGYGGPADHAFFLETLKKLRRNWPRPGN